MTDAEERRHEQHLAAQQRIREEIESKHYVGRTTCPNPRRGRLSVPAASVGAGATVRIRRFDYEEQRYVFEFAEVAKVEHDPGCPWNGAYPPSVWLFLICADGYPRPGRLWPDVPVELEQS